MPLSLSIFELHIVGDWVYRVGDWADRGMSRTHLPFASQILCVLPPSCDAAWLSYGNDTSGDFVKAMCARSKKGRFAFSVEELVHTA